jgi:hypothetical protein
MSDASGVKTRKQAKRAKRERRERASRAAAAALALEQKSAQLERASRAAAAATLEEREPPAAPPAASPAAAAAYVDPQWVDDPEYTRYRQPEPEEDSSELALLGTPESDSETPITLTFNVSYDVPMVISAYRRTRIAEIRKYVAAKRLGGNCSHCRLTFGRIELQDDLTLSDYGIVRDSALTVSLLFG